MPRIAGDDSRGHVAGEGAYLVEVGGAVERSDHMQAPRARGLHERHQTHLVEQVAQLARDW
jgi:hypothetical protein